MTTKQNLLIALAIVAALITGYSLNMEPALAQDGSSNGYIALKIEGGSINDSAFALISTEQKSIMIYKVNYQKSSKKPSLELEATRSFKFDEQFEEWKTEPKLSDIEKAVLTAAKNSARKK